MFNIIFKQGVCREVVPMLSVIYMYILKRENCSENIIKNLHINSRKTLSSLS